MKQEILRLLYPNRCPICEEILAPKDKLIHNRCRKQLVFIEEPKCLRCGKPIEQEEVEYCFDCKKRSFHYLHGYPCIKYDKNMSKSISAFKFKGKKEYAQFYIDEILNMYEMQFRRAKFDVVIPIPIHASRYKERGFNQAELIAEGISKRIQVPIDTNVLVRTRKTLPQKELDEKERLRNLQKAFELAKNIQTKYERILLVDDIYTTGSTIEACANLLVQSGVTEVCYTSVCIGHGY